MNERPFFFPQGIVLNDYKFLKQCYEFYQLPWHYLKKKMQRKRWKVRKNCNTEVQLSRILCNNQHLIEAGWHKDTTTSFRVQVSSIPVCQLGGWVLAPVMVCAVRTVDLFTCSPPASGKGSWHFLKQCWRDQECQKLSQSEVSIYVLLRSNFIFFLPFGSEKESYR